MNAARLALASGLVLVARSVAFAQETTRISVDSSGAQGNNNSYLVVGAASADGSVVAFASWATNLVPGDGNALSDIFVHDLASGITEIVSLDSAGVQGDSYSELAAISADGRFVAFDSFATNLVLGDQNGVGDIFVHDRSDGSTERVSVDSSGAEADSGSMRAAITADGGFVAFESDATNLVAGDTNLDTDVFIHDQTTGATERVSVDSSGVQGDGHSDRASVSSDGRFVAFESIATNLVAGDTNLDQDIFVHDRTTGVTERVSVNSRGRQQNGSCVMPSISGDGRFVVFASSASNLVPNDTNGVYDVFVHDRDTGTTERVSVDSAGGEADGDSISAALSADGRIVLFGSYATNLVAGDQNLAYDLFVHDRSNGATERVSVDSSGAEGDLDSIDGALSADGERVAFDSDATNLVTGDTNGVEDVFVHDRCGIAASWTNYGFGWPGTLGVPSFTASSNPVIGTTITLDIGNSLGAPTGGLLFLGFQRADLPTGKGGDLLVAPAFTLAISFWLSGDTFTGELPDDGSLCGFSMDLQAIEFDPGATAGVSFTPGLELVLGR